MWLEILRCDLKKRKGLNAILLFFVLISTMFLASSVNNINLVLNGIGNYMAAANVGNLIAFFNTDEATAQMEELLDGLDCVSDYERDRMLILDEDGINLIEDGNKVSPEESTAYKLLGSCERTYVRAVTEDGEPVTLKSGEIAVSVLYAQNNGLKVGDEIKLCLGDTTRTYTVACIAHDFLYGAEMISRERLLVSPEDFAEWQEHAGASVNVYTVVTEDPTTVMNAIGKEQFATLMGCYTENIYLLLYAFDMVSAGLIAAIGICLILISLMILKFSIRFTIEESYREIGLLKALGFRERAIRKIVVAKYLVLVVIGAVLGFGFSLPLGTMLMKNISDNLYMGNAMSHWGLNACGSIVVVLFVLWMCMSFTRRIKKCSAVEAMRNGKSGERYHRRRGTLLHHRKKMGTILYLGLNDVCCSLRQYVTLLFTFCISFLLITIPLNTCNTMKSSEMLRKFNIDPEAAVYVEPSWETSGVTDADMSAFFDELVQELAKDGYEADINGGLIYMLSWEKDGAAANIATSAMVNMEEDYRDYTEGSAPVLENEAAFSETVLKDNGWQIGDTVYATMEGEKRAFLITGSYTDYMELGKSCRLGREGKPEQTETLMYTYSNIYFDTELSQEEIKAELTAALPQYEWKTGEEIVNENVGSIKEQMEAMLAPVTVALCGLIMLIVFFMVQLFIVREQGQIAMLKSIGFSDHPIRNWFLARFLWISLGAWAISIPLSNLSNRFVLTPVFGIMGARVRIQVDLLQAYLLYPVILLIGIMLSVLLATFKLKSVQIQDIGNQE